MFNKLLLKRFRAFYQMFHLSIDVFVAFALLTLANLANPGIALAQVDCTRWFPVKTWTGTFSNIGTGSGQLGTFPISINESASGTILLDQAPDECVSGSGLRWTGVLKASVNVVHQFRITCPANSTRPEFIRTYRASGAPTSGPADLIFFTDGTYRITGGGSVDAELETQNCDGTTDKTIVPHFWGRGSFITRQVLLPTSGLNLSKTDQFQENHNGFGVPVNWQQSWNLTSSVQQLPKDLDDQRLVCGSIIGCQNQTLGEALAVVGTPFVLHYQSDRVRGRTDANVVAVKHAQSLGGWSLNVHHAYDPTEIALFLGNGRRRSIQALGFPIPTPAGEFLIASEDGSEIYVFDNRGLHLRTLESLTAAIRYEFGYDAASRLITVTDGSMNVTTIQRDASGNPTRIVAPFGKNTQLTVDANGFLSKITNPAGALTIVSVLRYVDGTWHLDDFREKTLRHDLDELVALHGLPLLAQQRPFHTRVRVYSTGSDPLQVDPTAIQSDLAARYVNQDCSFDLRVLMVKEGAVVDAYLFPWTVFAVPGSHWSHGINAEQYRTAIPDDIKLEHLRNPG